MERVMNRFCAFLLLPILALAPSCFAQDEPHHHHDVGEKLGTVSFPVSCAPVMQAQFERGMALLYSFEYETAINQFEEIQKKDPACAMAYWGQAMSLYHQLWERPSKADLQRGAELLAKARSLNPPTTRERDYIQALTVFYTDTDKLDHQKRAEAYTKAMRGVYERNPQDREAAVLYALALLASAPERDPDLVNAKAAVAILNKLYEEQPDHPGIAHYIIHSCDNPSMASLALPAARKYASIAPASAHAVHMPSHIFARLGLWQDDINSNLAAIQIADQMAIMHIHVMHHKMHSMDFLEYAYLQIGDDVHAKAEADAFAAIPESGADPQFKDYFQYRKAMAPAMYAIERRDWKEALNQQPAANTPPHVQLVAYWSRAIAAGHLRDSAAAQDALKHGDQLIEATRKGDKAYLADSLKDTRDVMQAWADYASGKTTEALALLRSVADTEDKIGKGETDLPVREMLADMLMQMQKPQEALVEYEISLRTDPNRFNGLYGAAQAAELSQQKEKAAAYYAQLLKNCDGVHSDRPELSQAKTLLASK
jgi:tetratricopeptide (TPR) repeat protein